MSRILHGALVASAVTTLTIDAFCQTITITNRSQTGEIYFTVDGSTPAAGGADDYVCLGVRTVAAPNITSSTTVKMISTGALQYSVTGETQ